MAYYPMTAPVPAVERFNDLGLSHARPSVVSDVCRSSGTTRLDDTQKGLFSISSQSPVWRGRSRGKRTWRKSDTFTVTVEILSIVTIDTADEKR